MLDDILSTLGTDKSTGIIRASDCLRQIDECVDGICPGSLFEGLTTSERWRNFVKDAESRLVFASDECQIKDFASSGMALSPNSILDFDCIITANNKDRDEDILETKGADLDLNAPLLMFHNPELVVGALVSKGLHTDSMLGGRFKVLDTTLGRDAKVLVEGGALRISHGFEPTDYAPLKGGRYHVKKFKIYEVSLVPIPANPTARITAHFSGKMHTPFFKAYCKEAADLRPVIVPGVDIGENGEVKHEGCACKSPKTVADMVVKIQADDELKAELESLRRDIEKLSTKEAVADDPVIETAEPEVETPETEVVPETKRIGNESEPLPEYCHCPKCGYSGAMGDFAEAKSTEVTAKSAITEITLLTRLEAEVVCDLKNARELHRKFGLKIDEQTRESEKVLCGNA
jgi:HK97 family phage prohead protease